MSHAWSRRRSDLVELEDVRLLCLKERRRADEVDVVLVVQRDRRLFVHRARDDEEACVCVSRDRMSNACLAACSTHISLVGLEDV